MAQLNARERFNALANADHIFSFVEEKVPFTLIDIINQGEAFKAIVRLQDGTIKGVYSDSPSAKNALHEVFAVFSEEQPLIQVGMKKTGKDKTIYTVEILE